MKVEKGLFYINEKHKKRNALESVLAYIRSKPPIRKFLENSSNLIFHFGCFLKIYRALFTGLQCINSINSEHV